MNQPRGHPQPVVRSLLERASREHEAPLVLESQVERALRDSVKADLERLLNTRRPPWPIPGRLDEVGKSILTYGLRDVSSLEMSGKERLKAFIKDIQETIRRNEPRLRLVLVRENESAGASRGGVRALDGVLRLTITAELNIDGRATRAALRSDLDETSGEFRIDWEGS